MLRRRLLPGLAGAAHVFVVSTANTAAAALPIPSAPGPLLVPRFIGSAATADPIASYPVPQHPHLAPNGRNNMHNDAYATDAYTGPGPLGRAPVVTTRSYGVEECATEAFDAAGRIVALCGNLRGPVLRLINPRTLAIIATKQLPPRNIRPGTSPLSDLCGGTYFYLDDQDRAVVATTDRHVVVIAESLFGFVQRRSYDVSSAVPSTDCLIALMPDWSGRIWFESGNGIVGSIDPDTGRVRFVQLAGEIIDNSFAVDETGGVFIVSDHALYRFDAGPDGTPIVTWRQAYDRGTQLKTGQLAQGSGTTPTLVGPDLVAITDNAEPRMNVLVYQRGKDSGGQPVCGAPVFGEGASATENSLVAVGDSLLVENNYGYKDPTSTLLGATTTPGIAKVDVVDGSCQVAWTSNQVAPTSVPKASLATGLLYVYTKPKTVLADAWYFTAIDIRTGRTVFSKLTGTGPGFNNHYAAVYLGPDGTAYIATLAGMVRIKDSY
ncbi:MAG: hypothetical protein QOH89_2924 [Pseudonocardiales bacterium]|nr:hypothetical protein [Pseudonocardiales bacterium]